MSHSCQIKKNNHRIIQRQSSNHQFYRLEPQMQQEVATCGVHICLKHTTLCFFFFLLAADESGGSPNNVLIITRGDVFVFSSSSPVKQLRVSAASGFPSRSLTRGDDEVTWAALAVCPLSRCDKWSP